MTKLELLERIGTKEVAKEKLEGFLTILNDDTQPIDSIVIHLNRSNPYENNIDLTFNGDNQLIKNYISTEIEQLDNEITELFQQLMSLYS